MTTVDPRIQDGRDACEQLSAADQRCSLDVDDLDRTGLAAYLVARAGPKRWGRSGVVIRLDPPEALVFVALHVSLSEVGIRRWTCILRDHRRADLDRRAGFGSVTVRADPVPSRACGRSPRAV